MADKKNQHYVPKFLLRKFSSSSEKLINFFNLKRERIFRDVSLADQCYEAYFYGEDLVTEDMLGLLETTASKIIVDIVDKDVLPLRSSMDHEALLVFVLLQHARTKYKAKSINLFADQFTKKHLVKQGKFSDQDLENISISLKKPSDILLSVALDGFFLSYDLDVKLLINKTNKNFVLCDNPVVYRNQFAYRRTVSNNIGLACMGLQIFFPISPKHLLIFFDKNCYKIGKKNASSFHITDDRDVARLNHLQFLNADENVYFGNSVSSDDIFRTYFETKKYASKLYPSIRETSNKNVGNGISQTQLDVVSPEQKMPLFLSFIKQRKSMSTEEKNSDELLLRNNALVAAWEDFNSLVKKNIYNRSQFRDYLISKSTDLLTKRM